MRIEALAAIPLFLGLRREALDVCDKQLFARLVDRYRTRKPADRDQAKQLRLTGLLRLKLQYGDCILSAIGHVQAFARAVERQCVRRATPQVGGLALDPDRFLKLQTGQVDQRKMIIAGIGANQISLVRGDCERRGVLSRQNFLYDLSLVEINYRQTPLRGSVPHRVDSDRGPSASWPDQVSCFGPTTSPIADISPLTRDSDIVRSHPDSNAPQNLATGGLNFQQLVGEIPAHIKPRSVRAAGQPAGDFLVPPRCLGRRQRKRVRSLHRTRLRYGKDLDRAVHIAQVNLPAIWRED